MYAMLQSRGLDGRDDDDAFPPLPFLSLGPLLLCVWHRIEHLCGRTATLQLYWPEVLGAVVIL
eukprot:gene8083-408_t